MTTPESRRASPEALIEHSDWIRRLAYRMTQDAARADDLAQDTWVRLLTRPPKTDRPLRGFIATVMRNLRSHVDRSERRRLGREHARAKPESEQVDAIDRVERQRELTEIVLALDEPYRTTLVLRYFEGCSPRRIAKLQTVPVSTVKTRLARGLDQLRTRLERAHGSESRAWLGALLPLLRPKLGAAPWLTSVPTGVLIMNTKLLTAAVLALAAGGTWLLFGRSAPSEYEVGGEQAPSAGAVAVAEHRNAPTRSAAETAARIDVEAGEAALPTAATASTMVDGVALSVAGQPIAGVAIGFEVSESNADIEVVATSGADGRFSLDAPDRSGRLVAQSERLTTVLSPRHAKSLVGLRVLVVAPDITVGGHVVDSSGAPVANATVEIQPPEDLRGRVGVVVDESVAAQWRTSTDREGRFVLARAAQIEGSTLAVRVAEHPPFEQPAPSTSQDNLWIALPPTRAAAHRLEGIVVDTAGSPVDGALVAMGLDTVKTHVDGSFSFDLDREASFNRQAARFLEVDVSRLLAIKPGYLPGSAIADGVDVEGRPTWPNVVKIELGGEPLSIQGQVLDERGAPLPDIRVWIADPTFLGALGDPSQSQRFEFAHVEPTLAGVSTPHGYVDTEADGRFRIDGLLDRNYTVHAMDMTTLQRVVLHDVPAGQSTLVARFTADDLYETLRGTVVDSKGMPIPGVQIFPMCDSFRTVVQGRVARTRHSSIDGVRSDAAGKFELRRVPRNLVYLRIEGEDTIPIEWGRHVEGGLTTLVGDQFDDLKIRLPRRCHFTVELDDPSSADELAVLDVQGDPLEISEFLGTGRREGHKQPIREGKSNPLGVSDEAATLVLYRDGEETRRLPIQLDPEDPRIVRP